MARLSWILIALSVGLAIATSRVKSAAYDEPKHLITGVVQLEESRFVGNDNTPITAMFGLPHLLGDLRVDPYPARSKDGKVFFVEGAKLLRDNGAESTLRIARIGSHFLWLLLLIALLIEGRHIAGTFGGLVAVILIGFDGTSLFHGSILSADLPLCTFGLIAWIAQRRFQEDPSVARTVAVGIAFGLLLLSKLTGAALLAALVGCFAIHLMALWPRDGRAASQALFRYVIALLLAGGALAGAYGGDPGQYVAAIQRVSQYANAAYFDQALSTFSFWFYPAALAFKAGPVLLLIGVGGLLAWTARCLPPLWRRESLPTTWPLLVLSWTLLALPILSGYQQGIRFLLPALPFVSLLGAAMVAPIIERRPIMKWALGLLLAFHVGEACARHPNHLATFNALAGGSEEGGRWFVDSNFDWGQNVLLLRDYLEEDPHDRLYAAIHTSVPMETYGLSYENLYDSWADIAQTQGKERVLLAISENVYRYVLAAGREHKDRLFPLMKILESIPPDDRVGNSIRVWRVDEAFVLKVAARFRE